MKEVIWENLYSFLEGEEGCNFRKNGKGETTWDCDGLILSKTKVFCKKNNIDFVKVKELCRGTGGYCDCEVLLNTRVKISEGKVMPK